MKIKMISLSVGALVLALAGASYAADAVYTINDPSNPVGTVFDFNGLTDDFEGSANLSKTCVFIPVARTCSLNLSGNIYAPNASQLALRITDGSSSTRVGDNPPSLLPCEDISFTNFDWEAIIDNTDLPTSNTDTDPVAFEVEGIVVETACGNCSGSLVASYTNTGLGEFSFGGVLPGTAGNCSVSGTLDSINGTTYRVWQE